jgi:hypothetical protein
MAGLQDLGRHITKESVGCVGKRPVETNTEVDTQWT